MTRAFRILIIFLGLFLTFDQTAWADKTSTIPQSCLFVMADGASGGPAKRFDTLSYYTLFYLNKMDLYPVNNLGAVTTIAQDYSYPGRVILGTAYYGAVVSYRPPNSDTKKFFVNGLADKWNKSGRTLAPTSVSATMRQVFKGKNSEISKISTLAGKINPPFLVRSNNGLNVIKDSGDIIGVPFGASTLDSVLVGRGLIVTYPNRMETFQIGLGANLISKEVIPFPETMTVGAVAPQSKKSITAAGANLYSTINRGRPQKFATLDLAKNESVKQIQWSGHEDHFFVRTNSRIFIFQKYRSILLDTIPLKEDVAFIEWEASGQYLAVSTTSQSFVYETLLKKVVPLQNLNRYAEQRLTWLNREGILATVVKALDSKNLPYWLVEFWDPTSGENLSLNAKVEMDSVLERPPYVVGDQGRLIDGNFEFGVLTSGGQLHQFGQVFKEKLFLPENQLSFLKN